MTFGFCPMNLEVFMKLLIAIDGSKQSDAAIEACGKFIKSVTYIKILSVVEQNYLIGAEPYIAATELYAEVTANEQKFAAERVKSAENKLREMFTDPETEITSEVLNGNPGQIIVEEAAKLNVDLIIVGSHGYGFWERAMIGSVSDSVIHHASCSVLVVK
jgi:nucleotide-binding universal stress UspA family protein